MRKLHDYFMQHALELARDAARKGEVPVAALVVKDNQVIGQAYNNSISTCDPTAHAEIIALRAAGQHLNNYRLLETTVYVTLEPCMMCAMAMVHARVKELIFGAYDEKSGAIINAFELLNHKSLNHQIAWKGGVLETECNQTLKNFFKNKR